VSAGTNVVSFCFCKVMEFSVVLQMKVSSYLFVCYIYYSAVAILRYMWMIPLRLLGAGNFKFLTFRLLICPIVPFNLTIFLMRLIV